MAIQKIGIPRGLMAYRDGILWKSFFENLGYQCVISPKSDRQILDEGVQLAIDETCLPFKIYLGHVKALIGACDAVFVPRMGGFEPKERSCTRYQSLPDLIGNIFQGTPLQILTLSYDWNDHTNKEQVYTELGLRLGKTKKEAKKAYNLAQKVQENWYKTQEKRQGKILEGTNTKILLAGHPYVLHDKFMGGEITEILKKMGHDVLYTDYVNRENALKRSYHFSKVMPWIINREITGSILLLKDKIDGIVLVSAYPCGPDALVNDMLIRKIRNLPILQLTLDAQEGTAGIETRIESFTDIIQYQKAGGYGTSN